jgi:hypothetical protein
VLQLIPCCMQLSRRVTAEAQELHTVDSVTLFVWHTNTTVHRKAPQTNLVEIEGHTKKSPRSPYVADIMQPPTAQLMACLQPVSSR